MWSKLIQVSQFLLCLISESEKLPTDRTVKTTECLLELHKVIVKGIRPLAYYAAEVAGAGVDGELLLGRSILYYIH